MHRQLSLITCAHLLATALATHQHIHRSPLETSPFDANPRAANATNEVEVIVASAWFPSWSSVPLSELSWEKYTHMVFAFAYVRQVSAGAVADLDTRVTTTNPAAISVEDAQLKEFVAHARNNNVSPLLAIGGWTGSRYFSTAVAEASRTQFVQAVLGLVTKYGLDGIDFDWEYPGQQGIGCNTVADDDSANFLAFLQQLRQENSTLVLTAAVGTNPFVGADKQPMTDVSAFAKVLDQIELMVYDAWGSEKTAGANAPLTDCPSQQSGSVTSAVDAWTAAQFPAEKIVLGLAAYGHSYNVTPAAAIGAGGLNVYPAIGGVRPAGPSDIQGDATPDACGNPPVVSGVFTFAELVSGGFLSADGQAQHNYLYDQCTQTPYVYDGDTHVLVSYDDAKSFAAKGEFIAERNLAGFAIWDVVGDHKDILVDSLYTSMNIQNCD
ncbi:chitinase [Mycena belliarum]|uniref:Chitinase n=1 Tax=Mycena belliarum TaxID=1033014 RepID=A0AAD6XP48_9AGAR|nr:chitinase [Mycena belliae]